MSRVLGARGLVFLEVENIHTAKNRAASLGPCSPTSILAVSSNSHEGH
jgi:hypothetical protein